MAGAKKILYFIRTGNPTEDERAAANKLGTQMFRNVEAFSDSDYIELCDGVAGCAPDVYLKRFPQVDALVEVSPPPPPPPPPPPAPASPVVSSEPPPPWQQ